MSTTTAPAPLDITRDATPTVVGEARSLLGLRLGEWGLEHYKDGQFAADAKVILSELASNALDATPGERIRITAIWESSRALRLAVWDRSGEPPVAGPVKELTLDDIDQAADCEALAGGRGLPLVEALSGGDCGYSRTPPLGKWVYARLRL